MTPAADSFGSYGAHGQLGFPLRAARALDRVVTGAILLALVTIIAFSGYSLWDDYRVLNADDGLQKPTSSESFAALRAINPDVIAWLTVDNTNIDYPVVQGEDNFEYLNKDARGDDAVAGSIFLDAACDPQFHEPYEVIMGHHMQYGKMFGDLDKFLDQRFFDENRSASIMLPDRTLDLDIVAVLTADAYDGIIFGTPACQERMDRLVSYVGEQAVHQRPGEYSPSDQLVALSTCASSGATARTVLICRVVGEERAASNVYTELGSHASPSFAAGAFSPQRNRAT